MDFLSNNEEKIERIRKISEREENDHTSSMLSIMDDLIRAMQQLQKMMVSNQQSNFENRNEQLPNICEKTVPQSQAAKLLQQVQTAMEATVAQLSTSGKIYKTNEEEIGFENKMAMSISEKWKMYTELIQIKDEPTREYCITKMRLGQELGLSFKETRREMLIGLWSHRLCMILFLKNHKDQDGILSDIDEWERIEKSRNDVSKKYRNKNYKY